VQTPVWPSQYEAMQLVQVVADPLQVAHGDVHITQAPETKVYPTAQAVQVLGDVAMAVHATQEAPTTLETVASWKPRLHVAQTAAVE